MKKFEFKKSVLFLLCIGSIFFYLNLVFSFPAGEQKDGSKEKWDTFYRMEDDTLDAVYLGNSAVDRYWVSPRAWNKFGITVYPFAISSIPCVFIKSMIEESLKTQDVDLIIIDIRTFTNDADALSDVQIRRVLDNMKWSQTKLQAMQEGFQYASYGTNDIDSHDLSWYIPLLRYHSRWGSDFQVSSLYTFFPTTDYGGYAAYQPKIFTANPQKTPSMSQKMQPLEEENHIQLKQLLKYCDTLDCHVLFVDAPYSMTQEQREKSNTIGQIIKSSGYELLEFNTDSLYQSLELNFSEDFYDAKHVNYLGAIKYTDYLSEYLVQEYQLNQYANATDHSFWEDAWKKLSALSNESMSGLLSGQREE